MPDSSRSQVAAAAQEAWRQRGVVAPDAMRSRGLTLAGLLMTLVGAFTAGILFSNRDLGNLPKILAMLVLSALTVSVAGFAAAGLHSRTEQGKASTERQIVEKLLNGIHRRLNIGRWAATVAGLAALALAGALLWSPAPTTPVRVVVTDGARSGVAALCRDLPPTFHATVETAELKSTSPHLALVVSGKVCGQQQGGERTLFLKRQDIVAFLEAQ